MKTWGIILAISLLVACDNQPADSQIEKGKLVARVGDLYVHEAEVDFQTRKLATLVDAAADREVARKNIIESIVLAKLMAQKQLSLLDQSDLATLELEVQAFREERLVQKYMTEQVKPEPVTSKQVEAYYQNNISQFGGGDIAQVEYWQLTQDCKIKHEQTEKSTTTLKQTLLAASCNRSQSMESVNIEQLAMVTGKAANTLVKDSYAWINTKQGQTVAFINQVESRQPKPLVEVASVIRQMLAPQKLKTAIEQQKDILIKEMEIEYFD